jgi:ABC-type branched-subunit amino acid transport system substrate-binding protein
MIDKTTLPRQGENALGVPGAQQWVNDLPNEANKEFVANYKAKYKAPPSMVPNPTTQPFSSTVRWLLPRARLPATQT